MPEQLLTFQLFTDIELARDISERLTRNNIEHRLEKLPQLLDATIAGVSSSPDYAIKLKAGDFIPAHRALEEYYKKQVDDIEPGYYLFEFSNDELKDILAKPDEWGPLDYQLAQKILRSRGQQIDEVYLKSQKDKRLQELAAPERGNTLIGIGYLFTGYVLIVSYLMYISGSYSFPYSIFVILLIGRHLAKNKKTLPDGSQVFSYNDADRKHGNTLSFLGIFLLLFQLFIGLVVHGDYSFELFELNYY
ncbi:MAG TPA: hypothetical protein PKG90_13285 [Chitinophagaceae bacterium]|nr:hypothetical protein [Chitinophagaceae bacterium]HNU14211.1 hypothetical protein [Chitinophagaceae bacterium]